jgi:excisionase family DNA binding protein
MPRRRLSVSEVAEILDLSAALVRKLADEGRIPYSITPGGWRRFERADVERFRTAQERR